VLRFVPGRLSGVRRRPVVSAPARSVKSLEQRCVRVALTVKKFKQMRSLQIDYSNPAKTRMDVSGQATFFSNHPLRSAPPTGCTSIDSSLTPRNSAVCTELDQGDYGGVVRRKAAKQFRSCDEEIRLCVWDRDRFAVLAKKLWGKTQSIFVTDSERDVPAPRREASH